MDLGFVFSCSLCACVCVSFYNAIYGGNGLLLRRSALSECISCSFVQLFTV